MTILLHRRLLASQNASADTIAIDQAVETAITDLRRVERGIIFGNNPPSEFTRRKIACIASRLLHAVVSEGVADAIDAPSTDHERGE